MFKAEDVQKLRAQTGAGVMECKRALEDAAGDFDRAVELIQERGFTKAEKRAGRSASAGLVHSYVHNGRVGVLLELNCETDFVAKNEEFKNLAHELVMQIAAMNPQDDKEFLEQEYIKDSSITIKALIKSAIAKIGENIKVGRFIRYEL
ncbi:MAG: translation elongation factor Ts [Candidatus Colwellbacteria bacterium]|nr:translation elongation factor Ts [Candidatus Colwellbacteria bacterium]